MYWQRAVYADSHSAKLASKESVFCWMLHRTICSTLIPGAVWGMRVGNNSVLASILASSTDIKRIQTPHILFRDF